MRIDHGVAEVRPELERWALVPADVAGRWRILRGDGGAVGWCRATVATNGTVSPGTAVRTVAPGPPPGPSPPGAPPGPSPPGAPPGPSPPGAPPGPSPPGAPPGPSPPGAPPGPSPPGAPPGPSPPGMPDGPPPPPPSAARGSPASAIRRTASRCISAAVFLTQLAPLSEYPTALPTGSPVERIPPRMASVAPVAISASGTRRSSAHGDIVASMISTVPAISPVRLPWPALAPIAAPPSDSTATIANFERINATSNSTARTAQIRRAGQVRAAKASGSIRTTT